MTNASAAPTVELTPAGAPLSTGHGRTTIAPVVVEKIAVKSASEVDGVGPGVRTGLGRLVPWVAAGTADAEVGRESVALELTITVRYPRPVRQVTSSLRDHAVRRIEELTGLAVRRVDITVAELVDQGPARRRVE
ncbi:MAG: Asp23/Gls24 family envelope stress response protein [Actinomycetota bacterium]|nr:Asp23/Gls24 family envelope stress response protein [Actinomycetota bacterium]